uniref:ATP-dependent RNA helicase SUV3 homolog, mitochondrial n=1 Tax=Evadne anonyx TaxID=141404 RepID=A0A9N6WPS8_9CRUS|nr:EOG090X01V1 [Evadne anonyx]
MVQFHQIGLCNQLSVVRSYRTDGYPSISKLVVPAKVKHDPCDINVGSELTGKLNKDDVLTIIAKFCQREQVKIAASELGLDNHAFHETYKSFRRFCLEIDCLPVDLHITLNDIIVGGTHVDSLLPYFIRHARKMFSYLDCKDDLIKISDLRSPASWYQEARAINRKIIFHAGPTNSGKTYHALERFKHSKSGVYCSPLKLLANEVFQKCNSQGIDCDLVTGEERLFAREDNAQSPHIACTVEMASINTPYEVAVIDEIQMLKDPSRGWAWTRAVLGIVAEEIHLCGEKAAIDVVKEMLLSTGEQVQVREYQRLTSLTIEETSLQSLENIRPGDCLVCFSKNDIYWATKQIEALGKECAVIYGSLPPGTKLAQAKKFNDPDSNCKVLVATDAIGMGLNLNIGRVIFFSMIKTSQNEKGEIEKATITASQALQIAGRAGRYGTQFANGFVTTMKPDDLPVLKQLLSEQPPIITQVGLHPTADQIELYAYHLPNSSLSNLMDIFVNLSTMDHSLYFMCNMDDFKFLAEMIEHVPLPLRARYVFCCAPINKKMTFVCSMFLKFSRQYSRNEAITYNWLCHQIGWPFACPKTMIDLIHLESVFDVLDLYLWLSYRFQDLFPDAVRVRHMGKELDTLIQTGVTQIVRLLTSAEKGSTNLPNPNGLSGRNSELKKAIQFYESRKEGDKDAINEPKGPITERLLSEGRLTPQQLEELKKEWQIRQDQLSMTRNSKNSYKIKKALLGKKRKPKL